MTFSSLVSASVVGVILAEIGIRSLGSASFDHQLCLLKELPSAFQQAQDDAARQALLLRSGLTTLRFSALLLLMIAAMTLIAMLPPWALVWSARQETIYWVALSVIATVWWFVRPVLGFARTPPHSQGNPPSR